MHLLGRGDEVEVIEEEELELELVEFGLREATDLMRRRGERGRRTQWARTFA